MIFIPKSLHVMREELKLVMFYINCRISHFPDSKCLPFSLCVGDQSMESFR